MSGETEQQKTHWAEWKKRKTCEEMRDEESYNSLSTVRHFWLRRKHRLTSDAIVNSFVNWANSWKRKLTIKIFRKIGIFRNLLANKSCVNIDKLLDVLLVWMNLHFPSSHPSPGYAFQSIFFLSRSLAQHIYSYVAQTISFLG